MRLWTKVLSLVGVGIITWTVPLIPDTDASGSAVKVKAKEIRHDLAGDFKGNLKNIDVTSTEGQAVLTLSQGATTGTYTSPVLNPRFSFTDVGAHWKDQHHQHPKVSIRVSTDRKHWTDWTPAEVSHAEGPEGKSHRETFTDLLLGYRGKYIQYQIQLKPGNRVQDFQLTLLNSEEGAPTAHTSRKWTLSSYLWQQAEAAVSRPPIVSRAQWGADESLRFNPDGSEEWPREYDTVTHLVIHHTATQNNDPDPAARVRSIYYYHTVTRDWGDIGYNAIIGSDGRIYEGRHGRDGEVLSPGVIGAHAYSFNHGSFGVAVMGSYDSTQLPESMRKPLIDLLAYEADHWNINPRAKRDFVRDYEYNDPSIPKTDHDIPTIQGHGLLPRQTTECPGNSNESDLPSIRRDVAERMSDRSLKGGE
ncbi:hypothetical protein GCM10011571_26830 [Marinithermofilum abyssi]|uniref:Peptidoglycan recognition protein family domain-containing protein n=1 Tax=Marinithermofilum abyssi TaxID=1571185 RepID=A0A8J2YD80_9BACL|nr:N-acetylmuramoyl-L-alanine amidase [Marinithermofilum abyssi]GGE23360.1 hypothetical protein GCM10011571_26830 [Marinithermofilum abyssi]